MPIEITLALGDRVSYSDMANPFKSGTITEILTSQWGDQYRVQWDNGVESIVSCKGPRWNVSSVPAPSDEELAAERAARAVEKAAREEFLAIPVISYSKVETAKLIRVALKAAFPGVKFSVRISHAGGSTDISWDNGPTMTQVKAATAQYESEGFDAMQDMRTYAEPTLYLAEDGSFVRHSYNSGLILEQRSIDQEIEDHLAEVCNLWDGGQKVDGWRLRDEVYRFLSKTDLSAIDYRTITTLYGDQGVA